MEVISCLLTDECCSDRYKNQRSIQDTHLFLHFKFQEQLGQLKHFIRSTGEYFLKIARRR